MAQQSSSGGNPVKGGEKAKKDMFKKLIAQFIVKGRRMSGFSGVVLSFKILKLNLPDVSLNCLSLDLVLQ